MNEIATSVRDFLRADRAFWGAACAGIEAPEPDEPAFAQLEALNREVFTAFAVNGMIQIDYETVVTFARPF
jgi:hypothetical protein